jgi:hypothetical protein
MTIREAARSLRRYVGARFASGFAAPTYTTTWDVTSGLWFAVIRKFQPSPCAPEGSIALGT